MLMAGGKKLMKTMILEDFEKLLDLYLKGRLSAKQKAEMEKLLDELNKDGGKNVEAPYEFTQQDADKLWNRIDAKTMPAKVTRIQQWLPMAAVIAVVAVASLVTLLWLRDNHHPSNKIILADGSLVWLKGNATLESNGFSVARREVRLTGEALFEVARDTDHPFVIHCGRYVASVLGTSFNINATDSAVEITVLTGKVKIASAATDESIVVGSHERVVFSGTKSILSRVDSKDEVISQVVENTQYDMHFEDTRMSEIVKRVEGKFDVTIELENEALRNCMISADFTDQSLPVTLTMISEALGIQYELEGSSVTIRGAGCPE
jgi:transmembrane sensor